MRVAIAIAAIVGVPIAALYFAQGSLLFPAPPPRPPDPALGELIRLPATVALWRAPRPGSPVVVHFHGNGEQLADLGRVVAPLQARGLGVLAVEYPGYGLAPGSPSEDSLVAAGVAAVAHLKQELHVDADRIVLQGQSLGSGVATQLAVRGMGVALILISPFTSVPDVASQNRPLKPFVWMVRDRFDTRAAASEVRMPVLVIHGTNDEVVPFSMGQTLAREFAGARLVSVEGGRHNDLWTGHAVQLADAVARFANERR